MGGKRKLGWGRLKASCLLVIMLIILLFEALSPYSFNFQTPTAVDPCQGTWLQSFRSLPGMANFPTPIPAALALRAASMGIHSLRG